MRALETRSVPKPQSHRLSRRRKLVLVLLIALSGFAIMTARFFIWPDQGMPSRVDAIVMLDGHGDRLNTAIGLAYAHRASAIVISRPTLRWGHGSVCAPKIPRVKVICFVPKPATTRGEAEFASRLARQHRWRSIVLVAIAPQDTVARLRAERCFSGDIYVVNAALPASDFLYSIFYYWGATIKALFLQRSC